LSQQERWDVVLQMLNGPMKAVGEQKLRGPVIRIGANPGPGGFALAGYRGLDARQCVITAYTGGTAAVAPVGTNQVRLASHSNVNWRNIDPITGPEYLSPSCALHLGPVGRGATIEFVRCERFGQWEQGQLVSEATDVEGVPRAGAVPASYDARRVNRVVSSTAPIWFLGCMSSMAMVTATMLVLIAGFRFIGVSRKPPGPVEEGLEFYKGVDATSFNEEDAMLLKGLEQGYFAFVAGPNIDAAGSAARPEWSDPENFDPMFMRFVTKSVDMHLRSWSFFRRLDAVNVEYGKVVLAMRKAGLPEVFAAIPYRESRYGPEATSEVCAKGIWQFMPESALRVHKQSGESFRVQGCRFIGNDQLRWEPTALTPPTNARANADYMQDGQCMITTCDVDDRTNINKATDAAVFTLSEAWNDPVFAESGSAVQLTITSHNAGYDDSRFGPKKRFNVKPAYLAWLSKVGKADSPYFNGQNIRCPNWDDKSPCGAAYMAETQHYAYNIVAQHLLAACYYARNYGENPAFQPYRKFTASGGYCDSMDIPTKEEVRAKK
jgi:hypothetical protein